MLNRRSSFVNRNWLVPLLLLAAGIASACLNPDRKFETELRDFRYSLYQKFPDLADTTLSYYAIMNRTDSLCAGFLAGHEAQIRRYFERRLKALPSSGAIDTTRYQLKDSLTWGDSVSIDLFFAEQKSMLKVINSSPEGLANSYRAMFLARSLGVGEYSKYQFLNSVGQARISRQALGRNRVALVIDTWQDIVRIVLQGSNGVYQTVRIERYVRRLQ